MRAKIETMKVWTATATAFTYAFIIWAALIAFSMLVWALAGCAGISVGVSGKEGCTEENSIIVKQGPWADAILVAMVVGVAGYETYNPAAQTAIRSAASQAADALEGGRATTVKQLTELHQPLVTVLTPLSALIRFDDELTRCDRLILAAYLRMI